MEELIIEATKSSPYVCLDPAKQNYEISGQSFPEDPKEIYNPIFKWLETNIPKITQPICFKLYTEYFNSASNRLLLKLFRILEMHAQLGKSIEIIWYYTDEDSENDGMIFQKVVNLPFELFYNPLS